MEGIIIYTIGEWYTNGMADEGRLPPFHAAQWRGENPSYYCENFSHSFGDKQVKAVKSGQRVNTGIDKTKKQVLIFAQYQQTCA